MKEKICRICNQIYVGATFCPTCGNILFVPNQCECDCVIPDGAKFCPDCGIPVKEFSRV